MQSIIRVNPAEKELAISRNDGQEIIEIMRDTAGQPANGFHFLRFSQLGVACCQLSFRELRLRHVAAYTEHTDESPVFLFRQQRQCDDRTLSSPSRETHFALGSLIFF